MTQYALISTVPGIPHSPGATLSTATDNIALLVAAGCVLAPLPNAGLSQAQQ